MKRRKVTIILGAGASKAYARWPYPLLAELLPDILEYACRLSEERWKQRQQRLLAYALRTAYELPGADLAGRPVLKEVIQQEFKRVKTLPQKDLSITAIFRKLEDQNIETSTKAYWDLTYAIAVYMWQMAEADVDQLFVGHIDRPHEKLISLIDRKLSEGMIVNVVDFNWDCVLERAKDSLGENCQFGWDCGRKRRVIADRPHNTPLSKLVEKKRFQRALDYTKYTNRTGPIKPHGDWCTFLRGTTEVFYRGGRHSHTHTATSPPSFTDISSDDGFVRSAIMPPTSSKFRHGSQYYEDEKQRLISALTNCDTVISIGWSASGPDDFYREILRDISRNSPNPNLYAIDWSQNGRDDHNLENRLQALLGGCVSIRDVQMTGFNNAAVERLERLL